MHIALAIVAAAAAAGAPGRAQSEAALPAGVRAVWDPDKAYREATQTRERVCINGLWRWQPAGSGETEVPRGNWGFFKVPGSWPGVTNYMQKDCQTVHVHPAWRNSPLRDAAWYQREITISQGWTGRRIALAAEYVNSYAVVYMDGRRAGEILFPGGEADLTQACRPGARHVLSVFVLAMPMKGVILSFSDTNAAREVKGSVARRGFCGDVWLVGTPAGPRVADVKVDTSVRRWEISFEAGLEGLDPDAGYVLRAEVLDRNRAAVRFTSPQFKGRDLKDGRMAFSAKWKAEKLWDIHTPQNVYDASVSLLDAGGKILDTFHPVRFGFREFWIDGRDFHLNGTRIHLSAVPVDSAQIGAAWACYDGARESLRRLKEIGINLVYTHNYDCMPGSHLGFAEILRAADDAGMLVSFSQPHFGHYDWKSPDADRSNGYARHAEFYVRRAQNHPSVVMYSMSHNSTGYSEDMHPDMIDGVSDPRSQWSANNARLALRAEAIVRKLDPGRIVYHHSSGNLSSMHTSNFYPNWAPVQELDDWFEHWATKGVKPLFTCEYAAPFAWDWMMYRGWYRGQRSFGSARVPWEFCIAEWNAQFIGDRAYEISEREKKILRWEARKFRAGEVWHRWDYPVQPGSRDLDECHPIYALYLTHNWRAFRTWGVSMLSPWDRHPYWKLREGTDRGRRDLKVDWESLQRPGFSPDFIADRYELMEYAYERSDWIPTAAAQALVRNNGPLLAYIGGKPARFTSKDHNFFPGETVEKQLIVINDSRETVECDCTWSFSLPQFLSGRRRVTVPIGGQERVPLRFELPQGLAPGTYELKASFKFGGGQIQEDAFAVHVLARPKAPSAAGARIALFDPAGETAKLLGSIGVAFKPVEADADLSPFDVLVIGKGALAAYAPAPDLSRVREGLKAVVFEQTAEALERRLGFRIAEYGLRNVFMRVPDNPLLAGLVPEHLRDWRGEATILPPRMKYTMSQRLASPTVTWCDIEVTRLWRCGCRGNVASVLIEKPPRGDFLPILDGGYSLQYSPLMEYREGAGLVLFCQVDVTGRTESDPAAEILARNIIGYVSGWKPSQRRGVLYAGDPAGKGHLERAGIAVEAYGGGKPAADRVLVVGKGGGGALAADVTAFLKAGGRLLAVGLDEAEANSFLPSRVSMKRGEHIAAFFEPFGSKSPLVGIGPADVHNRDPRELPLVTGGAEAYGNGVLAALGGAGVVFCQFAPWEVCGTPKDARADVLPNNLRRTFRRASFMLSRALANLGAAGSTPLLARFGSPAAKSEKRWLEGLYLDRPQEWDDPYRFFRW